MTLMGFEPQTFRPTVRRANHCATGAGGRTILEDTHSHIHLEIIFQNNCKWESHIKMLVSKCRCPVACLRSFKYRLSRKALETMYRSFILPQLDYADVIWDNCGLKLAEELESLHRDAIRTIIGAVRGTSHQKLYTELRFTTLRERRFRHKIIMYHKIVQENTPTCLKEHLPPLVSSTNPYHRRRPLQRQNTRLRLTGNHFSHRQLLCGIIYQNTYKEQNQSVKLNTSSPEMTQIPLLSFTTVVEKPR